MTRRKSRPPPPPPSARPAAPREEPDEEPAPPDAAELAKHALDRLAQAMHPELFMALQENIPEKDGRWLLIFAHAFDEDDTPSPLLKLQPFNLNPVRFRVGTEEGDARWVTDRLVAAFSAHAGRIGAWQARLSHVVITHLGEDRCAALGRQGMGDVIGAVETSMARGLGVPTDLAVAPLPLDAARARELADQAFAGALGRARLGLRLQQAFPHEDDEELDALITDATRGLEMRAGPGPAFEVEVRAGDRPWLPLSEVYGAMQRRLSGGLRVIR